DLGHRRTATQPRGESVRRHDHAADHGNVPAAERLADTQTLGLETRDDVLHLVVCDRPCIDHVRNVVQVHTSTVGRVGAERLTALGRSGTGEKLFDDLVYECAHRA